MPTPNRAAPPQEEGLPFDPRTLVLGVLRRWWMMALTVVVSLSLAVMLGKMMSSQVFQAETVLMYNPIPEGEGTVPTETMTLYTMMNLVKTRPNILAVRERLALACTAEQLAGACDVNARNNTNLMEIRAKWDTAEGAADIANALRDIFIENQLAGRQGKALEQARDIASRLQSVSSQLQQAEEALQEFTIENRVVDLSKEAQWLLEEQTALELLYQEETVRKRSIEMQMSELDPIIESVKLRVAEEKATSEAQMEEISTLHGRVQRLGDKITEDRQYRANMALLVEKEAALKRAQKLLDDGIISKGEFEKAKAEYVRQEAITVDSDDIKAWRNEMEDLDKKILPKTSGDSTSAGRLLYDMMLRGFEIQLEATVAGEKVRSLEEALEKVRAKLDRLPELQRTHATLTRDIDIQEAEKKKLAEMLSRFQRVAESNESAFAIVNQAVPPVWPISSTGKKLAIMIAAMGCMMGFALVLGLELLDTTIKTEEEMVLRLKIPALGVLPRVRQGAIPFPGRRTDDRATLDSEQSALFDEFQRVARRLRLAVPGKGARILVVGATRGEGVTTAVLNLAACFGRQDERVLFVDTSVRKSNMSAPDGPRLPRLLDWAVETGEQPRGLGDFLSYQAETPDEIRYPTIISGAECVPAVNQAVVPDLLASARMGEMLDILSRRFSVILLDVAPVLECGDAEALVKWADGVVLVVRSRVTRSGVVKKALARLQALRAPVVGAILNAATEPYYHEITPTTRDN